MDGLKFTSIKVQEPVLEEQGDGTKELVRLKRAVCKGVGRRGESEFKLKMILDYRARAITVSVPDGPVSASEVAERLSCHCAYVAGSGGRDLFGLVGKGGNSSVFVCRTSDPDQTLGILHRFRRKDFLEPEVRKVRSWI